MRPEPDSQIAGVRPADQKRSRILQDKFVAAGRKVLLHTRLLDVSIPGLARAAQSSVGGFYSRFESKEAFFEFLRMRMLHDHEGVYASRLAPSNFAGKDRFAISEAMIDTMLTVFSGPWRGVLREAYASIPERPDNWKPMNRRGQMVRRMLHDLYAPHFAGDPALDERISIAVQLLFSALNNELMNPHLAFRIDDPAFRKYLILAFDATVAGQFGQAPEEPAK